MVFYDIAIKKFQCHKNLMLNWHTTFSESNTILLTDLFLTFNFTRQLMLSSMNYVEDPFCISRFPLSDEIRLS